MLGEALKNFGAGKPAPLVGLWPRRRRLTLFAATRVGQPDLEACSGKFYAASELKSWQAVCSKSNLRWCGK
jgi:hypothetical protein